jgi:hypothetical protein
LERYFHIGCWTYVALATFIPAIAGKYDGGVGAGGCWLTTDNGSWWQFGTFYIPEGIALVVASCLIGHTIYIIKEVQQSLASSRTGSASKHRATFIRFGGFITLVLANLILLFAYRFYTYKMSNNMSF